jgi:hypothetical protein
MYAWSGWIQRIVEKRAGKLHKFLLETWHRTALCNIPGSFTNWAVRIPVNSANFGRVRVHDEACECVQPQLRDVFRVHLSRFQFDYLHNTGREFVYSVYDDTAPHESSVPFTRKPVNGECKLLLACRFSIVEFKRAGEPIGMKDVLIYAMFDCCPEGAVNI